MQKLDGSSLDLDQERIALLREAMPQVACGSLLVLLILLQHRRQIVTYQRISEQRDRMLGRDDAMTNEAIRSAIKRVRRGIEVVGWPIEIRTYSRLGYQLVAPSAWDWRAACMEAAQ